MMNTQSQLVAITIATLLFAGVITTSVIGGNESGKLGPIDSITFAGAEELTIKNSAGHISWGEEKTSTVWSVGFMETGKALSQLLQAEHFLDDRDDLNEELKDQMSGVRDILQSLREEGETLNPDDPLAPELRQRWDSAYAEFQNLQKLGAETRAALVAQQMESSYNEILEAVNVVSERMNIDMVLRFIPPDGEFEQGNPDSTIRQIRLRTALRLPDGIDITEEVLTELGLDAK
jgi:Skp family chaperone for outer membrane proteins